MGAPIKRVALYLQDMHSLQEGIKYCQYAEEKGFEAVWQAESRLVRDAIVPLAAFAATTKRLKVGSGVINNWTRNIGLLASTFLTLDDLAPNRVICGIGAWWDPLAANVGIKRHKMLRAMRETIEVMRKLLNMETVTYSGRISSGQGYQTRCRAWKHRAAQSPADDWCYRSANVGAVGSNRRWRGSQLLCLSSV